MLHVLKKIDVLLFSIPKMPIVFCIVLHGGRFILQPVIFLNSAFYVLTEGGSEQRNRKAQIVQACPTEESNGRTKRNDYTST